MNYIIMNKADKKGNKAFGQNFKNFICRSFELSPRVLPKRLSSPFTAMAIVEIFIKKRMSVVFNPRA